jgi:hypothetical protein
MNNEILVALRVSTLFLYVSHFLLCVVKLDYLLRDKYSTLDSCSHVYICTDVNTMNRPSLYAFLLLNLSAIDAVLVLARPDLLGIIVFVVFVFVFVPVVECPKNLIPLQSSGNAYRLH